LSTSMEFFAVSPVDRIGWGAGNDFCKIGCCPNVTHTY
jgi:hypothetical protein